MNKLILSASLAVLLATNLAQAEETVIPRFDVSRILLEGNTLLPSEQVSSILKGYVGSQKDFGTLQEAIEALETAYRTRGYSQVTVLLPEQELQGGVVRLQALEPKIRSIQVEGNQHFSTTNILAALPTLQQGQVPNTAAISENFRAVNENPAKKIALQFKSTENPADLAATIKVDDQKPWKATLSADNTGTAESGRYRTGVQLQHANLWNLDHVAAIQYMTSPDHLNEVKIFSGSYRIPFYGRGDTFDLYAGYSDVDNGLVQNTLAMSGKGTVAGLRYNMGLPRNGAFEQKLSFGFDYRIYDNTINLSGNNWNQLSPDYTVHPFSLTYGAGWKQDQLSVDAYISLAQNLPWGGRGSQAYFHDAFDLTARPDPSVTYTIVRYGLSKTLRLPQDILLHAAGTGQHAFNRLVPGEQFGLGGATSIRGYEEREEAYDGGFSGSLELYSPDLLQSATAGKYQLRLLGFLDGGTGYNMHNRAYETSSDTLFSTGAGIRLAAGERFNASLDWGYALKDAKQGSTQKSDSSLHVKAQFSF